MAVDDERRQLSLDSYVLLVGGREVDSMRLEATLGRILDTLSDGDVVGIDCG